jgi:MerR family transcriptional regulator, mercuric resistance operon regulatory protein
MARRRTIGRLAAEAGVHVETVRYYERKGLIAQPAPAAGGRDYGDEALWRLRYIKAAQAWGWSLADIAALLEGAERSPNFCASVRQMARRRIAEIDEQLAALQAQRVELDAFVGACAAKPDAERCPIFKRINRAT